jgi:zinc transport system ATP-binding protein
MEKVIQFQNVSKDFGTEQLLQNVSFAIESSTLTTLIGPNGAGKTTIAKLMLGLELPSSGTIIKKTNLKIGYVPQKLPFDSNFPITAEGFIKLIAPNHEPNQLQTNNLIDLQQLKNKDVSSLSGGQFQKLLLLATLLNKPDLLILDEPTQSLDVTSQHEFYSYLEKIRLENSTTIFMISHDLFTVMKNSDQVICLNKHICCSGRPSDVNNSKEFIDALSIIGVYNHRHDHKH